jgi:hypothetical protein
MFLNVAQNGRGPVVAAPRGARVFVIPRVRRAGRGLGALDFGGGIGPGGMRLPMPPLVPTYRTMMLQDGSHMVAHPMIDSFLERIVSEWENNAFSWGPFTPDQARQQLGSFVAQRCGPPLGDNVDLRPTCAGIDTAAVINRLVDHYTRWYNAKLANYYDILASYGNQAPEPGAPPPPADYVSYREGVSNAPAPGPVYGAPGSYIPILTGDPQPMPGYVPAPPPPPRPAPAASPVTAVAPGQPAYSSSPAQPVPVQFQPAAASWSGWFPTQAQPAGASAAGTASASAGASALTSFIDQKFTVAGYDIPVWAAVAAVVGGLWFFGGSKH